MFSAHKKENVSYPFLSLFLIQIELCYDFSALFVSCVKTNILRWFTFVYHLNFGTTCFFFSLNFKHVSLDLTFVDDVCIVFLVLKSDLLKCTYT